MLLDENHQELEQVIIEDSLAHGDKLFKTFLIKEGKRAKYLDITILDPNTNKSVSSLYEVV